jgi:hypothetical protein
MAGGKRDPIVNPDSSNSGNVKRADLLNGQPRTKSVQHGPPNFRGRDDQKMSFPVPDSPYGKGE